MVKYRLHDRDERIKYGRGGGNAGRSVDRKYADLPRTRGILEDTADTLEFRRNE